MAEQINTIFSTLGIELSTLLTGGMAIFGGVLVTALAFRIGVKLAWQVAGWFSSGARGR